jgi:glutaredoxin-like YruB-family protein
MTAQVKEKSSVKKKKQPKVIIFTTPTCSWCKRAMKYFRANNIKFKQVDVSRDPVAARDMQKMSGQMGVPVIKIGKDVIVGFDKPRIDKLLDIRG